MATGLSVAIEAIWERSADEISRRIATLERALGAAHAGDLDDELRAHAECDAHKLAGSLGMFGFATGSDCAREVELALAAGGQPPRDATRLAALIATLRDEFQARAGACAANDADVEVDADPGERTVHHQATRSAAATRTILVIDDSALIREVVRIGLRDGHGWLVHGAESGAEGIELAARERPDAILLDVEMPGLDGPATLARLLAHDVTRGIPVLFLTGHATPRDRSRLTALGAVGVIAKPFAHATLAAVVAALLGWAA